MQKINRKQLIYGFTILLLIAMLLYTRFVNLGWGLPYPMHPDERNMANAVQQLHCEFSIIKECFNPHFFAYGQFPLYLGYIGAWIMKVEAVLSLRVISAIASVVTVLILYKIILLLPPKKVRSYKLHVASFLVIVFSPVLIQFAHFGTTESLLILLYSLVVYYSLLFIQKKILDIKYLILTSIFVGLALATKVSSLLYLAVPLWYVGKKSLRRGLIFIFLTTCIFILFSPHNIISFNEFINSLKYESDVAVGRLLVFYTRQFSDTVPILFQLTKIFPYALGWPLFLLGGLGFLGVSWKKKEYNLLRFAFIVVFLPNAFMFAKWTRFMAPTFPMLIIFAILLLSKIRLTHIIFYIICFIVLLPGIAYLSIYQHRDVRFQASEWMYNNIPAQSTILSETANVVDIPLNNNKYSLISFNFYDLDQDLVLQKQLKYHLQNSDYIIVPSRRIFKNHPKETYPLLNAYYQKLFSGELGFRRVAEFSSYPRLNFQFVLPDEGAEETWTVFDHPVVRIYKKS